MSEQASRLATCFGEGCPGMLTTMPWVSGVRTYSAWQPLASTNPQ
ncbi:hypothetical protein [Streptomyces sp. NPDC059872]